MTSDYLLKLYWLDFYVAFALNDLHWDISQDSFDMSEQLLGSHVAMFLRGIHVIPNKSAFSFLQDCSVNVLRVNLHDLLNGVDPHFVTQGNQLLPFSSISHFKNVATFCYQPDIVKLILEVLFH